MYIVRTKYTYLHCVVSK